MLTRQQELTGWGRMIRQDCQVTEGATAAQLAKIVRSGSCSTYIARGLGRAYGDSSLNQGEGVLIQTARRRFLQFDFETGVLSCEAGVSLREIIQTLLPRGWFLPVTPGTKDVTIGGAIAADVHGKNHHIDGSFGNFVVDLDLLTASGAVLTCSPQEHSEAFWATVGGMGLTGIILRARIRLRRVPTAYCNVRYQRTQDLDETLDCFQQQDRRYRYSVAWVDCLAKGRRLGRSVVMLANEAEVEELPRAQRSKPCTLAPRRTTAVPFDLPSGTLNSWTVSAFNSQYYASHPSGNAIVDVDSFFYPLDRIGSWNRIYGRRGFFQYQAFLPPAVSQQGLTELLQAISSAKQASFLAVLKSCGAAGRGLLSYLRPGHTLALDIPNHGAQVTSLVRRLDDILLRFGGRLYLAKDATTTARTFAEMYPELKEFKRVKSQLDPDTRFSSSQARRLGIVESTIRARNAVAPELTCLECA